MAGQRPHPTGDVAFSGLQKDYDAARQRYAEVALGYIFGLCPEPAPPLVVDVGCGTGKLTRQFRARYASVKMIGCDANADMVAQARVCAGRCAHCGRIIIITEIQHLLSRYTAKRSHRSVLYDADSGYDRSRQVPLA